VTIGVGATKRSNRANGYGSPAVTRVSVSVRVAPPTAASSEITRSQRRSIPSAPVDVHVEAPSGSDTVTAPLAPTVIVRETGTDCVASTLRAP
jgi:hypothetical protein